MTEIMGAKDIKSYNVSSDDTAHWQNAQAKLNEERLDILGHPVMQSWESSYMGELAKVAASNGGRVLEVGFGMGIASRHLQDCGVKEHVIIEANADVFHTLLDFANKAPHKVIPIFGLWESVIGLLSDNYFDGILYDTYPTSNEKMHVHQFDFISQVKRVMKPNGVLSYCNLTSWGNLRRHHDCSSLFENTQRPYLQAAGFETCSFYIANVNPPASCEYYSYSDVIVPRIVKT
ncbi:class I SAM-dependent methyltransferase [Yersinia mollaretii]|uniref:class I SAM-dependent methyltransferase n=1 Tax=Yersinia mollaretii TaxID=33060 RepID=UPI0011A04947|nr:class I SAM-dependent methyltransferase [Yersinia mollaretii]